MAGAAAKGVHPEAATAGCSAANRSASHHELQTKTTTLERPPPYQRTAGDTKRELRLEERDAMPVQRGYGSQQNTKTKRLETRPIQVFAVLLEEKMDEPRF